MKQLIYITTAIIAILGLSSCGARLTKPSGGHAHHMSETGSHHVQKVYKPIYQQVNTQK